MARLRQLLYLVRLELGRTFFSRRALWVYLLAFAPAALFFAHSLYVPRRQAQLRQIAAQHHWLPAEFKTLHRGQRLRAVERRLGKPYWRRRRVFHWRHHRHAFEIARYTDGRAVYTLRFVNGRLRHIYRGAPPTRAATLAVYADVFNFYFLRLAVFFGCMGIFLNLFRGQMLDKTLHYYLLSPIRRETLLAGKYFTGLAASAAIFCVAAALQLPAMLLQFGPAADARYLAAHGWGVLGAYVGVTALACVGYGSIFLAMGLFFSNPIIPSAVLLLWESASLFLPPSLKHATLIYYLQSLCPLTPPTKGGLSLPLALLASGSPPVRPAVAIAGVLLFAAAVLAATAWRARRLEINYAVD